MRLPLDLRGLCPFRLHSLEQPRDHIYIAMFRGIPSLNSPKGSKILRRINKKIHGNKGSKKLKRDSDGLYKPLNVGTHEIRLLHIKPSSKLQKQPQCFLETVSLDDNPQFEALSYAWGDPNLTRPIRLENREWYATTNLEAGLRYLRDPSKEMVIWVDALCIDQSSVDERNSQVLLMKTIYSNARRVRIWLGEPTLGSDDALAIVEHLDHGVPFKDLRLDRKNLDYKHVMFLNELMNRQWWNRVWVQQEYVLAKNITLQCGLRSIDYLAILKHDRGMNDFIKGYSRSLYGCMQTIYDSGHLYRRHNRTGASGREFAQIIARGCFKDCTDLRDSIYGFLGLAEKSLVDAIRPDYSIPLTEVLQHTTVQHISCTGSLSFLSYTTLKSKNERLVPTWVPDWPRLGPSDLSGPGSTQNLKREQWRHRIGRSEAILNYKACATRSLSFEPINETTVMLNGNCSGEVTDVSPDTIHPDSTGSVSFGDAIKVTESWLKFFDRFADHTAFPVSTEGRESPFWRILLVDRYFDRHQGWRACNRTDYEAYQAMRRDLIDRGPLTEVAGDCLESFETASAGRRLFATNRGYIGLGPDEIQRGDHVYILSGGEVPYILRPIPGPRPRTFELVGDCYLHGIMYGEAAGTDEDYHDVYLE